MYVYNVIYIYIPGTHMTLVLEGSNPKIADKQVYTYVYIYIYVCRCHGILDRTTFLEADFFWFPNRSGASTSDGAVPKTPGSVHIDTRYGVFGCYELKARNENSRECKTCLAGFEVHILYICIYIYTVYNCLLVL